MEGKAQQLGPPEPDCEPAAQAGGTASHKQRGLAPGWAQGSLRSWREFQGIPVLKARALGKGSRTRRRYGWNTDHRVELEPELETGENPAQAALVLTGLHRSLTSPTAWVPEPLEHL